MPAPDAQPERTAGPDGRPDAASNADARADAAPRPRRRIPVPDRDDPNVVHLAPNVWVRREDLGEQFVRASGPGGQCVNKVSSAVILRLRLDAIHGLDERRMARLRRMARRRITRDGELVMKAQEFRSQRDNRRACEERLIELVHRAWDLPRQRKKTKPSRAARERRLTAKREHSQKKQRRAGKRPSADD